MIASLLKARGYATGMVGKWHLGWERDDMPTHYGFDFYYGIPAGEDETDFISAISRRPTPSAPSELARRYTRRRSASSRTAAAVRLHVRRPPRSAPRQLSAPEFAGRSAAGAYGDVIEQLDASVGNLMGSLRTWESTRIRS